MAAFDEETMPSEETEVGTWQKVHFENGNFEVFVGPNATPDWVSAQRTEEKNADTWSAAYSERKDEEGKSYWQAGLARTPGDGYIVQSFTAYGPAELRFDSEASAMAAAKSLPEAVKQTRDSDSTNNIAYDSATNSFQYKEPAAATPQA